MMSKTNQRQDQTLRSFASLLTVEKIVDDEDIFTSKTAYHSNNNEVAMTFGWKVSPERQKLFHSDDADRDNTTSNYTSQITKKDSATAKTTSVPISPMLRGFLSSYSCGLNGTTCFLPGLRVEEAGTSKESLPASVLKSFLKRGNPFPAATSYAKGKKKLQNRRRRTSKILLATSESLQNCLAHEDNKIEDNNEPSNGKLQYSFENMARNLSRPIFYSTESDPTNKDDTIKNQDKKDVASAPHIINSNIMSTVQMLMEDRMKHFMQTLVRKSILKNNGQITEGTAAVMSYDLECDAPTEFDDYNQFLREEQVNHSINILCELSMNSKSDFDKKEKDLINKRRAGDEGNNEAEDIIKRSSKIKTTVTELSFLSDLEINKRRKHRTAINIKRCITSFDVPRGVVGSVVKSRRASMELGLVTKDKTEDSHKADANEDEKIPNGTVAEPRKTAKANEKENTTSVSTTEVTLPLTFAVIIDANMGLDNSTQIVLEFGCPGKIKGTFIGPTSIGLLTGVDISLDTKLLLKAMENQIRFAIRKAIVLAMNKEESILMSRPLNNLPFSTDKSLNMSNAATGLHNRDLSPPLKQEYFNKCHQTVYSSEHDTKASVKDHDMVDESREGPRANTATSRLLHCLNKSDNKPQELGETPESKLSLFPKPTTHLNNIHGFSTPGKARQITPPLYQVSTFIPAHSCSALNEKKRKFSIQHAKTAAALSKNMNGIATTGPGGASAIIPTRLLNLSQTNKTSNKSLRQSPYSRNLQSGRRATIDTSQAAMGDKYETESSNSRRSSIPLTFATVPREVGESQKKQKSNCARNDEKAVITTKDTIEFNSREQNGKVKLTPEYSTKSEKSKRKQKKTVSLMKDKTRQDDESSSNTMSEDEHHRKDNGLDCQKIKRINEITVNGSHKKADEVGSLDIAEPVSTKKKRKASHMPHSEVNENASHRSNVSSAVSNKEIKKPTAPINSPMNIKRRRGGIHIQGSEATRPVDIEYDNESMPLNQQRRSGGYLNLMDVNRRTESSSLAESMLASRRRSSNNSMAAAAEAVMRMEAERRRSSSTSMAAAAGIVRMLEAERRRSSSTSMAAAAEAVRRMEAERRRSSSTSMAAAAEAVRRMEAERRRSSSNSMAAAAEAVRRMEASLDDDSIARVRRHSAGNSMAAAADVARRSLTAESLIMARRRSSGHSMAAAANAARRMEVSLGIDSSAGIANMSSVSLGNRNVIPTSDSHRCISLEEESAIAAQVIRGNSALSKVAGFSSHGLQSSVGASLLTSDARNATDYIGSLGISSQIDLERSDTLNHHRSYFASQQLHESLQLEAARFRRRVTFVPELITSLNYGDVRQNGISPLFNLDISQFLPL